jgi:hypothetical protein
LFSVAGARLRRGHSIGQTELKTERQRVGERSTKQISFYSYEKSKSHWWFGVLSHGVTALQVAGESESENLDQMTTHSGGTQYE